MAPFPFPHYPSYLDRGPHSNLSEATPPIYYYHYKNENISWPTCSPPQGNKSWFNPRKLKIVYYINRLKKNNLMGISIDEAESFNMFQYLKEQHKRTSITWQRVFTKNLMQTLCKEPFRLYPQEMIAC